MTSDEFSGRWPTSGTMLNGMCSELRMQSTLRAILPPMGVPASSSSRGSAWLTPPAGFMDASNRSQSPNAAVRPNLGLAVKQVPWPTPTVRGNHNRKRAGTASGDGLVTAVKRGKAWPTPKASDADRGDCPGERRRRSPALISAVKMKPWATPTARDWKSGKASAATMDRNSRPLSEQVGDTLNPDWVEPLMGFPVGWTRCAGQHGKDSANTIGSLRVRRVVCRSGRRGFVL